uniref:Putative secreted peptide n=1 Tax=Anopheles braziliensis TaxID=58242 RepID=A0A2M3ZUH3_9DIPT
MLISKFYFNWIVYNVFLFCLSLILCSGNQISNSPKCLLELPKLFFYTLAFSPFAFIVVTQRLERARMHTPHFHLPTFQAQFNGRA